MPPENTSICQFVQMMNYPLEVIRHSQKSAHVKLRSREKEKTQQMCVVSIFRLHILKHFFFSAVFCWVFFFLSDYKTHAYICSLISLPSTCRMKIYSHYNFSNDFKVDALTVSEEIQLFSSRLANGRNKKSFYIVAH